MEVRENTVSSGGQSSACTGGSRLGQCKLDLGTGSMGPVAGLTGAAVSGRGTSAHSVTLLHCLWPLLCECRSC